MKSPLLTLASCFALGILAAHVLPFSYADSAWLLAALCLLSGFVFLRRGRLRTAGVIALAGFVLAGIASAGFFQVRFPSNHIQNLAKWGFDLHKGVELEGVITSAPVRKGSGVSFDVNCRKIDDPGRSRAVEGKVQLRMFIPADRKSWAALDELHLRYGDAIRAPVRFEKPTIYKNPGNFDFRWWMEAIEDISWEGTIKSPREIEKLSASQAPKLSMLVAKVRARLLGGIDALYPPWSREGRVGAVLKAVLLGDRSSLDSDTVENFRQSGLYHLLVISGLHVGLLAAVVLFFLNLFRLGESWRAVLLMTFLVTYALLVEQRAPTLRASLMIGAYLLARYLYRDRGALNAVGFAALVLLVYRPAWLLEAGFQLSFSAALLIAGLAIPILERTTLPYRRALSGLDQVKRDETFPPRAAQLRLDVRSVIEWLKTQFSFLDRHPELAERGVTIPGRVGLWVLDLILFSAVIQVGLLMPMAAIFHRITLAGIGLNALALPLMTVLIALAVPTVILGATLPALAVFPGRLLLWVTNALLAITEFHRIPLWLSYRIPGPPVWAALSFALALIAVAWSLGKNARAFKVSLAVFALAAWVVVTYPFPPSLPKGMLQTTALDCGRGEALLTVLPDGTTMLVDAGGRETYGPDADRWNPGEDIVSPYLWSRGIKKIDILVLGNGSEENIKAMDAILRNFTVRELWRGPKVTSPAYQNLAATARERGVAIQRVSAGNQEIRGQAKAEILWPPRVLPNSHFTLEDDSLVLRIRSKEDSVLLRGDTGNRVARAFDKSSDPLASNILESARALAGLASQRKFLDRVNPQIVVISGKKNYGRAGSSFPVYQALQSANVRVLRTAVDGAVTVDADQSHLEVRCYGTHEKLN
ncbi:MAG TPA: ComEC/Rec2 family competence protein [Terriglobia bacterium]|nr:ComEC/Rec2 family competence protein [Terriglobia bacterium]